ncbi:MAG: hypothetical protein AABZ53_12385 [Planctomycetota bacterium]
MSLSLDTIKPGQNVVCTLTKVPLSAGDQKTVERLMRSDMGHKKSLRRAQHLRWQRLLVYNRGNRDWVSREKCAQVVQLTPGAKWTLPFSLDMVPDLKKVAKYVTLASK